MLELVMDELLWAAFQAACLVAFLVGLVWGFSSDQ